MTLPPGVRVVDDPAELVEFYSDQRGAHIYALVDLEPPFWEPSVWYRRDDAVVGFVCLPDDGRTTIYAVATRDPTGSLALLVALLPMVDPGMLITAPAGLAEAVGAHRDIVWDGPHIRYVLDDPTTALDQCAAAVEPIDRDRLDDLLALYDSDPGAAFFLPHMIDHASSVGVYDDGRLVAAAGTHVLSESKGCAAIGSVYTRPSHRGKGLGRAVTAGVVERIHERVDMIGLNVAEDNVHARAAYTRLGFRPILTYAEAQIS